MAEEGFKRKLTTILSADVVGYSRLMEDNEEATIQTLNTYRMTESMATGSILPPAWKAWQKEAAFAFQGPSTTS